jgi:small-conductance mechanosensitive channel
MIPAWLCDWFPGGGKSMIRTRECGMRYWIFLCLLTLGLEFGAFGSQAFAQQSPPASHATGTAVAPVIIDGNKLFRVRGLPAYPATRRAAEIRQRIIDAANDPSFDPAQLTILNEEPSRTVVLAGDRELFSVFEEDAAIENMSRELLATVYRELVAEAIKSYRSDRSTGMLVNNALLALAITAVFVLLLWATSRLFRWLVKFAGRDAHRVGRDLASKSFYLFHAGQFRAFVTGLLRLLRTIVFLALVYFYLNAVLGLFPWTRPVARTLIRFIIDPLESLWLGFVAELPNLIFLLILWVVTSYLLKILRSIFQAIEVKRIRLEKFEPEWAIPTYKIVRVLVIAFAVVVAYPYIPGSDSLAFKGVSVFVGVLLSLGSSSFIANLLAGLSMTYRGAFREGDRIKVGETAGFVEELKVMTTRVRTPKNEIVVIPNSKILTMDVVNYSQLAHTEGLLLHTTVGIGYDSPWRQVEAMLTEAARRTTGLDREPPPFVLQLSLGDFAVQYQINAFCKDVSNLPKIYSDLHANIQDVFNENGVQIMSPAYVADPAEAKVVPPEKWYSEPAKLPESP